MGNLMRLANPTESQVPNEDSPPTTSSGKLAGLHMKSIFAVTSTEKALIPAFLLWLHDVDSRLDLTHAESGPHGVHEYDTSHPRFEPL